MEVLGAAAAASQIAEQALGIISSLIKLYEKSKKAAETIRRQIRQLQQFKSITDDITNDPSLHTPSMALTLTSCTDVLERIKKKLERLAEGLARPGIRKYSYSLLAAMKEQDLEKLFDGLDRHKMDLMLCDDLRERRTVLHGMGGTGKSQIAFELCRMGRERYQDKLDAILWVDASSEAALRARYEEIADVVGSPEEIPSDCNRRVEFVKGVITSFSRSWFMVFDNFDDPVTFPNIEDYIPDSAVGSVLFTSRHADCEALVGDPMNEFVEVGGLETESAVQLFCKLIKRATDANHEQAQRIVQRLCYHPLAITQAASYVKKRKIPLDRFDEHYERSRQTILKHTPSLTQYRRRLSSDEYEVALNVFTTWELSYQQLEQSGVAGEAAGKLLEVSSFIAGSQISEELLRRYYHGSKPDHGEAGALMRVLEPFLEHQQCCINEHISDASDKRTSAPPGRPLTDSAVDIDPLPESSTATNCFDPARVPENQKQIPNPHEDMNEVDSEACPDHTSVDQRPGMVWSQDRFVQSLILLSDLSLFQTYDLVEEGHYVFSLHPLVQDWLRLRCTAEQYQDNFTTAARLIGYFIYLHFDPSSGRYAISAAFKTQLVGHFHTLLENLQLWTHSFAWQSAELCQSWEQTLEQNIVYLYQCGSYALSISDSALAYRLTSELLPPHFIKNLAQTTVDQHSELPMMLINMIQSRFLQGQVKDMVSVTGDLVDLCRRCIGDHSIVTMMAVFTHAQALGFEGREEEALTQYKEAGRIGRDMGGPGHWGALMSQEKEAYLAVQRGDLAEAEKLFRDALQLCREHHPPKSAITMSIVWKYACELSDQKRYHEALPLFRELRDIVLDTMNTAHLPNLPATSPILFEAKKTKQLTFEQIGKELGRDEVAVAAIFYGQAKASEDDVVKLSKILSLEQGQLMQMMYGWPDRGRSVPMPPKEPLVYRLYEIVQNYGYAYKAILNEKFGDGIMSAISFSTNVKKETDDKGDWVVITMRGKW
ncbi:MAG: hypothetical protein Q9162_002732 [Coniocarpon cinnabarinum]